jgi:endogenous inhibitor of DNA gyrase (YacG/DUF329 family)
MSPPRVKCPTCGREAHYAENNPFRPFCSERCRLIDLGAWLSEQRSIPSEDSEPPEGGGEPGGHGAEDHPPRRPS